MHKVNVKVSTACDKQACDRAAKERRWKSRRGWCRLRFLGGYLYVLDRSSVRHHRIHNLNWLECEMVSDTSLAWLLYVVDFHLPKALFYLSHTFSPCYNRLAPEAPCWRVPARQKGPARAPITSLAARSCEDPIEKKKLNLIKWEQDNDFFGCGDWKGTCLDAVRNLNMQTGSSLWAFLILVFLWWNGLTYYVGALVLVKDAWN